MNLGLPIPSPSEPLTFAIVYKDRPYASGVISVGRPRSEVKSFFSLANPVRRAHKSVRFDCFVTVLPLRWRLNDVNAKGLFWTVSVSLVLNKSDAKAHL